MSQSYYRNPRGRVIKLCIMFGSLCFSAYMLPKTIDKLGSSGLESLIQPGGGISPEAQRMLGRGGLESALGAERASTRPSSSGKPVVVITPSGTMTEEDYLRLQQQAQLVAPIKAVKGKPTEAEQTQADADNEEAALNRMLELLEAQKKGG